MLTAITFPSALIFWLTCADFQRTPLNYPELENAKDADTQHELLTFAEANHIPIPLHIMVPRDSKRIRSKNMITHHMSINMPSGSIEKLTDSISIISPELCFLLAARYLSIAELTVLACDLCAQYARNDRFDFKQFNRKPITTVEKITSYLENVRKINGLQSAKHAIRYALNNSNSPMESKMAAAGNLSMHFGGFSIESPLLNGHADLSPEGVAIINQTSCHCDMLWPDKKVVVEYDSDLVHLNNRQARYDKRRVTALSLSGYTVISVTKDYFRNQSTIEDLFFLIKKTLGQRINYRQIQISTQMRNDMIRQLFLTYNALDWINWAASFGKH